MDFGASSLRIFLEGRRQSIRVRSFGKGSLHESPYSRDSRELSDSRVSRETPDCGKQRRIRPFSRDSRESRDSTSEKTLVVITPFGGPEPIRNTNLFLAVVGLLKMTKMALTFLDMLGLILKENYKNI